MSDFRLIEVDPTLVATPAAGGKTYFVSNVTHQLAVKDETGTVTSVGGAGLAVGGDLVGTLPNPSLAPTAVVAAAYGDATHVATFTVDGKGRLTAAASVAITGAPPTGAAGGVLGGTYPNPTLGTFTSANLAAALSDETGSGVAVFGTGPTLSNPIVGTQTEGDNSTKGASTAYADRAVAHQAEALMVAVSDETTALSTGTAVVTFRMPFACSMTALPRANVNTVSSSGLPTFNIKKNGTTIFSTNLTIDASEKTSVTAATPAVLSSSPTTFADDDEITVDIVTAGTGTKGAKITLNVVRT